MEKLCEVQGCGNEYKAQGLCQVHYARLSRHGHIRQTRPDDWGSREKHPLYNTWCWMRKMRAKFSIDPEWEDFWKFVGDVGDRPSPRHQLRRKDSQDGYSKDTVQWVQIKGSDKSHSDYMKQWRKDNPSKVKNIELRKMFGITLEDYNKLLEAQGGVCAICGGKETTALAVDHCHKTGSIRGLLCASCNRGLGCFKDSIPNIQKATLYLRA